MEQRCDFTDLYPSMCAHCKNLPVDRDLLVVANTTNECETE